MTRASGPITAEIGIASRLDSSGDVEGGEEGEVVVDGVVVMPGEAGTVDEDYARDGGQEIIVRGKEGEVGKGFVGTIKRVGDVLWMWCRGWLGRGGDMVNTEVVFF